MGLDIHLAVACLRQQAVRHSSGLCARFVRRALEAGGLELIDHPALAREYRSTLLANGFKVICDTLPQVTNGYIPEAGDIAVIQPYPGGNKAGHITMYDGSQWISDFIQRDMWGGPGYRTNKPPVVICRFGGEGP